MTIKEAERGDLKPKIVVRANDVSRPYGHENPEFGTIAIFDREIRFSCEARKDSPVGDDYPVWPRLAGVDREEEQRILAEHRIVFEPGKLSVKPAPTTSCPAITPAKPVLGVAVSSPKLVGSGGEGRDYGFSALGLPPGLTMASDGSISGTPSVSGYFPYTVTIKNLRSHGTISCSLTVLPAPAVCCPAISPVAGNFGAWPDLRGSGGAGAPYNFSAQGLPSGLTMSCHGAISGTPERSGTFPCTITVTDSAQNTGTCHCNITVLPAPAVTCAALSPVAENKFQSAPLAGSGGVGGHYKFLPEDLPSGLVMAHDGSISGTPTQCGSFACTVTVIDRAGNKGTAVCNITVLPAPGAKCEGIIPVVGVGISSAPLVGSGGLGGRYTFSAKGLPSGLQMACDGSISGVPAQSGTSSYTVTVTDFAGNTGSFKCNVTVLPAPTVNCVTMSPVVGKPLHTSPLAGSGGVGGHYTFSAIGLPPGLVMCNNGSISGTPVASGSFSYTITVTDSGGYTGKVPCAVTVLSAREAEIALAKEELEDAIRVYEAAAPVSRPDAIRALAAIVHSGSKLKGELEHPRLAEPPEPGFLISFTDTDFPLPPGSSAAIRVYKPGESAAFTTVEVDPRTGEAFLSYAPGQVLLFQQVFNGIPVGAPVSATAS